jgi:hypothetical protein
MRAAVTATKPVEVSLLEESSAVCEELEATVSLELETTLLLDFGSEFPLPVTVIVPLFDAFFEAPVVVTVNL